MNNIIFLNIPTQCPCCGHSLEIITSENGVENLYCSNPQCPGKLVNRLDHFAGKKGLDIKGLSKATFEKLIDWGWIENVKDIYTLSNHKSDWIKKPGFGVASVNKILNAIEESKNTTLDAFISAIGIPLIGKTASKDLANHFETYEDFRAAVDDKDFYFFTLDNFGEEMNNSLKNFDYSEADEISKLLTFKERSKATISSTIVNSNLSGKTIVITGKLTKFKNRDELSAVITTNGGKVSSSISKKTDILINNDVNSTSSKNKKAKELKIPIISEEDFIRLYLNTEEKL